MRIYGFSGKLGTGKNYIAEKLFTSMMPKANTLVMALADQIKVECCVKDRVDFELAFHKKDEATRKLLQIRGTEEGRDKYGDDIWIRYLDTWIQVYEERGIERVIITDIRFPNELEWIRTKGGIAIRVEAPERNRDELMRESGGDSKIYEAISTHSSETGLDDKILEFDYIINNDYVDEDEVVGQIKNIVRDVSTTTPAKVTVFCDLDDTICECKKYYQEIIDKVVAKVREQIKLNEKTKDSLLQQYVYSYESRDFTRDDFAKSLVNFATAALLQANDSLALSTLINEIYEMGLGVYEYNYVPLNSTVLETVREMGKHAQVVIFTLGDYTEQMKKIAYLKLFDFPVEIFPHKDVNMFRYLKSKYPSEQYAMIGDSLKRDIQPAHEAGIENLFLIDANSKNDLYGRDGIMIAPRLNNDVVETIMKLNEK